VRQRRGQALDGLLARPRRQKKICALHGTAQGLTLLIQQLLVHISRTLAPPQLRHATVPGFRPLGAGEPVVDGEQLLPLQGGVEGLGCGVLLQRRPKVVGYHHGGAAG
jgi:hypothetical protein